MPHQPPGRRPRLAWTLLGLTLVLLASGLVLGLTGGEGWTAVLGAIPVEAAFAVVGALVAARTGNRLGWLFLAAGTVGAVTVATNAYAARAATAELPASGLGGLDLHRDPGDRRAVVLPDSAAVPGRSAALAAVAAGGRDSGHQRAHPDGVPGAVRRQLLRRTSPGCGIRWWPWRRSGPSTTRPRRSARWCCCPRATAIIVRFRRAGRRRAAPAQVVHVRRRRRGGGHPGRHPVEQ